MLSATIKEAAGKASIVIRTLGTRIVVEGIENETVRLFDCAGRCLQTLRADAPCTLQAPAAGVYLLQAGSLSPRKIVVL